MCVYKVARWPLLYYEHPRYWYRIYHTYNRNVLIEKIQIHYYIYCNEFKYVLYQIKESSLGDNTICNNHNHIHGIYYHSTWASIYNIEIIELCLVI